MKIIKNYLTKNRCYQQNVKRVPIGIQVHTIGTAQGTAQSVADYWNQSSVSACVTYIVDCDTEGKVLQTLPEDVRTWADTGYGNNYLITFEICESDAMRYTGGADYIVLDERKFKEDLRRGYNTAVELCADICRRYGWDPLARLSSGLCLISSHDEGRRAGLSSAHVDPTHIWPRIGKTMDDFRREVKRVLEGNDQPSPGTQALAFENLSEAAAASWLLEISREIAEKYSLLPSVCAAQTILESGYCRTELARQANNVCGMKRILSGNTWPGSVWDGESAVTILSPEQDAEGNERLEKTQFRKYGCIEDSITDRCAYLLGAKNGERLRYEGITGAVDYRQQTAIIKEGGYATDTQYVSKICDIIQRFRLDQYDPQQEEKKMYLVQAGAFGKKANAEAWCEEIRRAGFEAFVKEEEGQYKIQAGAFEKEENARKKVEALSEAGFQAFIEG